MCKGFVKIPRRIFETKWWHQKRIYSESDAIIDLYQSADRKNMMTTTLRTLADRWIWNQMKVSRFLERLQKDGYISVVKSDVGTIIKIIDFGTSVTPTVTPGVTPKNEKCYTETPINKGIDNGKCYTETVTGVTPSVTPSVTPRAYKNDNIISCLNEEDKNNKNDSSLRSESKEKAAPSDIVAFYNNTIKSTAGCKLPACIKLTDKRKQIISARLQEYSVQQVYEAISKTASSRFCNGHGSNGWVANIDFIFNVNNMPKILEGKYDDRPVEDNTQLRDNSPDKYKNGFLW